MPAGPTRSRGEAHDREPGTGPNTTDNPGPDPTPTDSRDPTPTPADNRGPDPTPADSGGTDPTPPEDDIRWLIYLAIGLVGFLALVAWSGFHNAMGH
jgi:hypothetical protein